MPRVDWNEKNMRYMMCFFPFVGLVIAALETLVLFLRSNFGIFFRNDFVYALIFTLVPIFVTGGIHFDGFMDTSDALGSHAPKERKLEILKDSHVGSFAVLSCAVYLLSFFVLSFEFIHGLWPAPHYGRFFCEFLIFVVSRALSAVAVCAFPIAKDSGLVRTFSDNAAKRFALVWNLVLLALSYSLMIFFAKVSGIIICAVSLATFAWYFFMTKRNFGGITGDTAGWFVQVCEILYLVAR